MTIVRRDLLKSLGAVGLASAFSGGEAFASALGRTPSHSGQAQHFGLSHRRPRAVAAAGVWKLRGSHPEHDAPCGERRAHGQRLYHHARLFAGSGQLFYRPHAFPARDTRLAPRARAGHSLLAERPNADLGAAQRRGLSHRTRREMALRRRETSPARLRLLVQLLGSSISSSWLTEFHE